MKIMIADDEEHIRLGIAEGFDWKALGLEVAALAADGKEALALALHHQPDIILLDINMPHMNGLEFMKLAKNQLPRTVFIILSGYDEFEYAQEAIALGVSEYLLKPISPRELSESLEKAMERVRQQAEQAGFVQDLENSIQEFMPLLREKCIEDILHQRYSPTDIEQRMVYTGIEFPSDKFVVFLIELEELLTYSGNDVANRQLTLFAVRNICDEVLNQQHWGMSIVALESTLVVLLSFELEKVLDLKELRLQLATAVKENIKRYLNLSVSIGVGNVYSGLQQIHYSYKEALNAIQMKALLGNGKLIDASSMDWSSSTPASYSYEKELLWAQYLRNGDERVLEVWEAIYHSFETSGSDQSHQVMILTIQQLFLSVSKIFAALDLNLHETEYDSLYNKLHSYTDIPLLKLELDSFMQACLDIINRAKSSSYRKEIEQVKRYIQNHFNQDISLQILSADVYMNTNYLCTLFKSEVGETIHQYITRTRMEKAKELLQQTDLRIFEISEQVGFNHTSHFSHAFKKYTGITPIEFKTDH
jgi:two-component system response regulator YesN